MEDHEDVKQMVRNAMFATFFLLILIGLLSLGIFALNHPSGDDFATAVKFVYGVTIFVLATSALGSIITAILYFYKYMRRGLIEDVVVELDRRRNIKS